MAICLIIHLNSFFVNFDFFFDLFRRRPDLSPDFNHARKLGGGPTLKDMRSK
jgi:hypothetical protein